MILALSSIQGLNAGSTTTARAEFLKQVTDKRGVYKLLSGSDPRCNNGVRLNFFHKSKNDSFFLGQHIVFSLEDSVDEPEKEIDNFKCQNHLLHRFSANSVTQIDKRHHCPKELKHEEVIATSILSFEKKSHHV